MTIDSIKKQLYELTETFLDGSFEFSKDGEGRSVLHIILSDSIQAVNFVALIENEFEIEFDDEEIDLDFFLSFDRIAQLIKGHLEQKVLSSQGDNFF
ncbi:MAG: hypothetical protein DRQ02_05460 [Candidatus Latescibacterota bacterium]|nr:MAG: hypothetical protein DRQ02_05460 [Candidatus Latescibacterota bacterium]